MTHSILHSRGAVRLRRGFTLAEMLITLVILGIISAGLIKLLRVQARFSESQMALRSARTVSRNAMNIMLTDLRMVQDKDGLVAASRDSITVRIPLAFGLVCSKVGGTTIALLPVDSAMIAMGTYDGFAVRDSASGEYSYTPAAIPLPMNSVANGLAATCTANDVGTITYGTRTGRIVSLVDVPSGSANVGWPAFIYQQVTYKFDNSGAFAGRRGLWRLVKTSDPSAPGADEIIAPFDTSAKFRFYVLNTDAAQDAVPANLNDVRGIELVLAGSSNQKFSNNVQAKKATMVTGVFFKNRRDP